jgi:hypothetical protein
LLVFAAYNEEAASAAAVSDFGGIKAVDEVLVVDNNSGDHTAAQAESNGDFEANPYVSTPAPTTRAPALAACARRTIATTELLLTFVLQAGGEGGARSC